MDFIQKRLISLNELNDTSLFYGLGMIKQFSP